eukprot:6487762-Amphidinium_carterae.1
MCTKSIVRGGGAYDNYKALEDRFELPVEPNAEHWKTAIARIIEAFVTLTEAILSDVVVDKNLTVEVKRTRIQRQFLKVANIGSKFGTELKAKLLPAIARESVSKLVSNVM